MFLLHRCLPSLVKGAVAYVNFNRNHPINMLICELSFLVSWNGRRVEEGGRQGVGPGNWVGQRPLYFVKLNSR